MYDLPFASAGFSLLDESKVPAGSFSNPNLAASVAFIAA